jgi:hypothetical protein
MIEKPNNPANTFGRLFVGGLSTSTDDRKMFFFFTSFLGGLVFEQCRKLKSLVFQR